MYSQLENEQPAYPRRSSSAALFAPFEGGAGGEPDDWGSPWTPGWLEGAQGPASSQAIHV